MLGLQIFYYVPNIVPMLFNIPVFGNRKPLTIRSILSQSHSNTKSASKCQTRTLQSLLKPFITPRRINSNTFNTETYSFKCTQTHSCIMTTQETKPLVCRPVWSILTFAALEIEKNILYISEIMYWAVESDECSIFNSAAFVRVGAIFTAFSGLELRKTFVECGSLWIYEPQIYERKSMKIARTGRDKSIVLFCM